MGVIVVIERLRALLDPLDSADVECDGMARLVCTVLSREQIEHSSFVGQLQLDGQMVRPHFWVEVGPVLIDYRARMWLGERDDVPHGVCLKSEIAAVCDGELYPINPLPAHVFQLLALPRPEILMQQLGLASKEQARKPKGLS
jgi:hypothetical protein